MFACAGNNHFNQASTDFQPKCQFGWRLFSLFLVFFVFVFCVCVCVFLCSLPQGGRGSNHVASVTSAIQCATLKEKLGVHIFGSTFSPGIPLFLFGSTLYLGIPLFFLLMMNEKVRVSDIKSVSTTYVSNIEFVSNSYRISYRIRIEHRNRMISIWFVVYRHRKKKTRFLFDIPPLDYYDTRSIHIGVPYWELGEGEVGRPPRYPSECVRLFVCMNTAPLLNRFITLKVLFWYISEAPVSET